MCKSLLCKSSLCVKISQCKSFLLKSFSFLLKSLSLDLSLSDIAWRGRTMSVLCVRVHFANIGHEIPGDWQRHTLQHVLREPKKTSRSTLHTFLSGTHSGSSSSFFCCYFWKIATTRTACQRWILCGWPRGTQQLSQDGCRCHRGNE